MNFIEISFSLPVPDVQMLDAMIGFSLIWLMVGSVIAFIQCHRTHCRLYYRPPLKLPGEHRVHVFFIGYFSVVLAWPLVFVLDGN